MALPKFSFSGWNSSSLSPKVNPASVPVATSTAPGKLVAQTNAANTNLPAWLQSEVDRVNAQDALRTQLMGQVGGTPTGPPAYDPNLGVAAVTDARARYNTSLNQINEQSRLQQLIQQQDLLRPSGSGFTNPFDVNRSIALGNQIENYQRVNLPLASAAVGGGVRRNAAGWVQSPWI